MSRALRECAIEAHLEETEDFFDTIEIEVALALLTCIDNMKRDVQLISVLHSEVFGFSPDELARIRIEYKKVAGGRSAYWKAFKWFSEEGPEGGRRRLRFHRYDDRTGLGPGRQEDICTEKGRRSG